ncbi:hypothetical protein NBRC116590_35660 [Pelagimonas sp. KU-00592-HH]
MDLGSEIRLKGQAGTNDETSENAPIARGIGPSIAENPELFMPLPDCARRAIDATFRCSRI